MTHDFIVKKVLAKNGEREIIESSIEEMQQFIVDGMRSDFRNTDVICIKFLHYYSEDDDCPEESSWYINPYYCSDASGRHNMLECHSAYGPNMDPSFVPEILLIDIINVHEVLKKYDTFNTRLMVKGDFYLSDDAKYARFLQCFDSL